MRIADALELIHKRDDADGEYREKRWQRIMIQKFDKTFESIAKELKEANKKQSFVVVRRFRIFGYVITIRKYIHQL